MQRHNTRTQGGLTLKPSLRNNQNDGVIKGEVIQNPREKPQLRYLKYFSPSFAYSTTVTWQQKGTLLNRKKSHCPDGRIYFLGGGGGFISEGRGRTPRARNVGPRRWRGDPPPGPPGSSSPVRRPIGIMGGRPRTRFCEIPRGWDLCGFKKKIILCLRTQNALPWIKKFSWINPYSNLSKLRKNPNILWDWSLDCSIINWKGLPGVCCNIRTKLRINQNIDVSKMRL